MYGLIDLADMVDDAFRAEGFDGTYEVTGHHVHPLITRGFVGRMDNGRTAVVWFTNREERIHASESFVAMKVAAAVHGCAEAAA